MEVMAKSITMTNAAGSDELALPLKDVKRLFIGFRYTVTDAGIVAGEDMKGLLTQVKVKGDNTTLLEVQRDEMARVIDVLSPLYSATLNDPDEIDISPTSSLIADGLPTTAEEQRGFFTLNFPHKFSMYDSVLMSFTWGAPVTEWAGVSAFTGTIIVAVQYGSVPRSIALTRVYSSSATFHSLSMGDYPIIGGIILPSSYNVIDTITIKGKDRAPDFEIREEIFGQALYSAQVGVAPATDDAAFQMLPVGILIPYYADRVCSIRADSAITVTAFFISLVAEHIVTAKATKSQVARGEAPQVSRVYENSNAGNAGVARSAQAEANSPAALLKRLVGL